MLRKAELCQVKNNGPLNTYMPYVISWHPRKHRTSMEKLENVIVFPKTQSVPVAVVPLEAKLHGPNFLQHSYINVNKSQSLC